MVIIAIAAVKGAHSLYKHAKKTEQRNDVIGPIDGAPSSSIAALAGVASDPEWWGANDASYPASQPAAAAPRPCNSARASNFDSSRSLPDAVPHQPPPCDDPAAPPVLTVDLAAFAPRDPHVVREPQPAPAPAPAAAATTQPPGRKQRPPPPADDGSFNHHRGARSAPSTAPAGEAGASASTPVPAAPGAPAVAPLPAPMPVKAPAVGSFNHAVRSGDVGRTPGGRPSAAAEDGDADAGDGGAATDPRLQPSAKPAATPAAKPDAQAPATSSAARTRPSLPSSTAKAAAHVPGSFNAAKVSTATRRRS